MILDQVAEVQLSYKPEISSYQNPIITCSGDINTLLRKFIPEGNIGHKEYFYNILLSRSNRVLGVNKVSEGGVSGTVADSRIIFQSAILANASGLIIAHNHPSGNLKPSQSDIAFTNKIKKAILGEISKL